MPAAEFHIDRILLSGREPKCKYNGRFVGATSWIYSSAVHRFWKFFRMKKIHCADFISIPGATSLLHETDVLQSAGFRLLAEALLDPASRYAACDEVVIGEP